ncbi:MAG TPA: glycosyl transferase, partial [Lachnospiraceae bacterium]|nr:glycosyl transferase [Lachnospiraceae bacterium]
NFYYYFIGRDDQSVNQEVMTERLDQQARVNKIMIDYFSDNVKSGRIEKKSQMYKYMYNYLEIITSITSVLAVCSGEQDKLAIMNDVWDYLEKKDPELFKKMRYGLFGTVLHLPGKGGRTVIKAVYSIARGIFGFN